MNLKLVVFFVCIVFCCRNSVEGNDNTLKCCSGYELINGECKPICREGCPENKVCYTPEWCTCIDNTNAFERCKKIKDKFGEECSKCQPAYNYTENGCKLFNEDDNSFIIEFDPSSSTDEDQNVFATNCLDGLCDDDETSTTIQTPEVNMTSNCKKGCWGSKCLDGICQCGDGLIYNEKLNDCVMPCEANCQNGICNQDDNKCTCNQGYVHKANKTHSGCVPYCEEECINSVCVVATECECFHGDFLELKNSSASKCLQTCEGCQNGTCVALNKCQCYPGFVPEVGNRFVCLALAVETTFMGIPQSDFFTAMWIVIGILTTLILILFGFLILRKMQSDKYYVRGVIYDRGDIPEYSLSHKD